MCFTLTRSTSGYLVLCTVKGHCIHKYNTIHITYSTINKRLFKVVSKGAYWCFCLGFILVHISSLKLQCYPLEAYDSPVYYNY